MSARRTLRRGVKDREEHEADRGVTKLVDRDVNGSINIGLLWLSDNVSGHERPEVFKRRSPKKSAASQVASSHIPAQNSGVTPGAFQNGTGHRSLPIKYEYWALVFFLYLCRRCTRTHSRCTVLRQPKLSPTTLKNQFDACWKRAAEYASKGRDMEIAGWSGGAGGGGADGAGGAGGACRCGAGGGGAGGGGAGGAGGDLAT